MNLDGNFSLHFWLHALSPSKTSYRIASLNGVTTFVGAGTIPHMRSCGINFRWRVNMSAIGKFLEGRGGLVVGVLLVASCAPPLVAQEASLASIYGKVVDQQGAILPGVAVKATSPSLQSDGVATTTDSAGNYRLANLPAPGVYRVSFELSGFNTFIENEMNLAAGGFAARLDVNMQ